MGVAVAGAVFGLLVKVIGHIGAMRWWRLHVRQWAHAMAHGNREEAFALDALVHSVGLHFDIWGRQRREELWMWAYEYELGQPEPAPTVPAPTDPALPVEPGEPEVVPEVEPGSTLLLRTWDLYTWAVQAEERDWTPDGTPDPEPRGGFGDETRRVATTKKKRPTKTRAYARSTTPKSRKK